MPDSVRVWATALIALIVCVVPGLAHGDQEGHAVVSVDKQKYSYDYRVYSPLKHIDAGAAEGNDTALSALKSFFSYMKSGDIASWKRLWADGSLSGFKGEDEALLNLWKTRMSQPVYLASEIRYGSLTIFATAKTAEPPATGIHSIHYLRPVAGRFLFVQAPAGDAFAEKLLMKRFDPAAGKFTSEPTARYAFERARQFFELEDVSEKTIVGTDHSINNAKGFNVRLGEGRQGRGLVFDGNGYVEMPRSAPLSLSKGQVFIEMAVSVSEIPRDEEHRDEKGRYKSVILERGKKNSAGRFSLEAVSGGGNGNEQDTILRFSVGDGELEEDRYIPVTKGAWHDIALSYSAAGMEMTVDGIEASLGSGPGKKQKNVYQPFDVMYLGRSTSEKPFFFSGSIDELAISNDSMH
jgi:hypothetical protein